MKMAKELSFSIIVYAFLGYLRILFIEHSLDKVYSSTGISFVIASFILLAGNLLFAHIVKKRISLFNEYKNTQALK